MCGRRGAGPGARFRRRALPRCPIWPVCDKWCPCFSCCFWRLWGWRGTLGALCCELGLSQRSARDVRDVASRRTASRLTAGVGVVVTVIGLVFVGSAGAAPTPPPNPSDHQISQAHSLKDQLANRVGQLSGQLAQAKVQLGILQGKAELAEQKFAYAVSQLQ